MINNDAELTKFVLQNCKINFPEEFIQKLQNNSQTSKLSTKYNIIREAIINKWKNEDIQYTQQDLDQNSCKAYVFAKTASGKFMDIRQKTDSTKVIEYILQNYEDGYKYIVEALFMKIPINNICNYVKGKIKGNIFYNKISEFTNSEPSQINIKASSPIIDKINTLMLKIKAKEDERKWIIKRKGRAFIWKILKA